MYNFWVKNHAVLVVSVSAQSELLAISGRHVVCVKSFSKPSTGLAP
jgi:hypothetical protein